jgi:hypothetical protein
MGRFVTCVLVLLALLSGCREREVTSYRIPKERNETPAPGAPPASTNAPPSPAMADMPVSTAAGSALTWTAPAHWIAKPASAMRKGSYTVPGPNGAEADLSITAFPGDVGGELANVNRWRGQLQLPAVSEAELGDTVKHLERDGLKFTVVELANSSGPKPQRMVGAMVPFGGSTWFFKLMGPDDLVAKEKPAFDSFLATIKPAASSPSMP